MKTSQIIKSIAHHRNGISGKPFDVAIVESTEDGETRRMLVIKASEADDSETYVLDLDLAANGVIEFGKNSWRGEHFAGVINRALKTTV